MGEGLATLLGGVQRLAERAGPGRARGIIYTADQYDAATFERWNIVNQVIADEAFESETRSFVERLGSGATLAYAVGKKWCEPGGTRAADRVVDDIAPQLFETEDMRGAVAALLEHGSRALRATRSCFADASIVRHHALDGWLPNKRELP